MINQTEVNNIVSIKPEIRASPATEFLELFGNGRDFIVPDLTLSLKVNHTNIALRSSNLPNYLLVIKVKNSRSPCYSLPPRVVRLELNQSRIYSVDNVFHKANDRRVVTRLQNKVLYIDLSETKVRRMPIRFFISMDIRGNVFPLREVKSRESIVRVFYNVAPKVRFNYASKSTKDLGLYGYPCKEKLKDECIFDKSIYNLSFMSLIEGRNVLRKVHHCIDYV